MSHGDIALYPQATKIFYGVEANQELVKQCLRKSYHTTRLEFKIKRPLLDRI